jgi:hypothetical protein
MGKGPTTLGFIYATFSYISAIGCFQDLTHDFTAVPGLPFKDKKGSPVHIAPACAGFGHFGSYVRSLSLHFCKSLFSGFEPMTSSWSQGNNFTAAAGLPFKDTTTTKPFNPKQVGVGWAPLQR